MSDRRRTYEDQASLKTSHPSAECAFTPVWTTLDQGPPHVVVITGVMKFQHPAGDGEGRFAEDCSGTFEMTLVLPDYVDPERLTARFEGPRLQITAPRREGAHDPRPSLSGDRPELSHSFEDVQCCVEGADDEAIEV